MLIPPWEKIIETKKCRISGQEFFVTDKDLEFYDKVSPVFAGKKYTIPSPTLCPEERMRNTMCFRNQSTLHKRKESRENQDIIAIYSEKSPYPIYMQKDWWWDGWDPKVYSSNFQDSMNFFESFSKLKKQVPRPHANIKNSENCEYTNYMIESKDCYLAFGSSWSEKTLYSSWANHSHSAIDCTACDYVRNAYELVSSNNCESSWFCLHCEDCANIWFSYWLNNCHNCLFCTNLQWKNFHIYNKPVALEEYNILLRKVFENIKKAEAEYWSFLHKKTTRRLTQNIGCENVIGEYLHNCNRCFHCYQQFGVEDCRYCWGWFPGQKNCMDCVGSAWELCYYSGLPFQSYCVNFSEASAFSKNSYYCDLCMGVSECFWCVWLHSHEHHCIMNKPYSAQEYEQLCGKIIDHMRSTGEWWEFFPHELSPFGYNETVAQEYFPMTREEVLSKGWNWYDAPEKVFEGYSIQPLPINQYDEKVVWFEMAQKNIDSLLSWIILCEVTKKPFKIIKQELAFYIENKLPIPTKHPDQRHTERMDMRNPRKLYERQCAECQKDIITTYAPERPERVVCEECYRKLVY
jgi:hypothetical protein